MLLTAHHHAPAPSKLIPKRLNLPLVPLRHQRAALLRIPRAVLAAILAFARVAMRQRRLSLRANSAQDFVESLIQLLVLDHVVDAWRAVD